MFSTAYRPAGSASATPKTVVNVLVLDIADGLVQAIRSVVNPDKLHHLGPVSDVALRGLSGGSSPLG